MRISTPILLLTLLFLGGCGLLPDQIDETRDWSADRIYTEAKSALDGEDYQNAIKYYEKLEARFPFGRYAQQAQLEIIYAYYKYEEPASAIAAADRFIKLHPRAPNVDYAYYMKGLANYNRDLGFLQRYLPRDASQIDPGAARQSFQDFSELLLRFPESKYATDARQRMLFLRNNLAQYELNVADFYLRRGAYVAAANRAQYVVANYPRTPVVADALALLAAAYKKMGMNDMAADALRVLAANQPDHPALKGAQP